MHTQHKSAVRCVGDRPGGVHAARLTPHVRVVVDRSRVQRQGAAAATRHKTATMTLDRYGHLFPDDLDSIADAFTAAAASAADGLRTVRVLKAVPDSTK